MDAHFKEALIQSFSPKLQEHLLNGTYGLNPGNCTYLINYNGRVICIVDGKIGEHINTPENVKLAQEFYRALQPQLKSLAQLTVAPHNASESLFRPATHATPKAKYPAPGPQMASPQVSSRSETLLSDEHYINLKNLLEDPTDSAYFNDNARAVTSLDGQIHYVPENNGEFKIYLTHTELPNYEAIKEHYTEWTKATSASAHCHRSVLRSRDGTKGHTQAAPDLFKAFEQPTPYGKPLSTKRKSSPIKQKAPELPEYQSPTTRQEKTLTQQAMTAAQRSSGEVQSQIQQFLDNIDDEIDRMNIPGTDDFMGYGEKSRIRNALKNKFALYREQFNSNQRGNTTQTLQGDLALLKEMQRSMYHAARSPDAIPVDLPLKGILNNYYNCLPISQNQCEIHNQNYLFFVTAYQLIGEDALCLDSMDETTSTPDKETEEKLKNLRDKLQYLENQIKHIPFDNEKKRLIIEGFKKKDPVAFKSEIERREQSVFENELRLPGYKEELAALKDELHQEETKIKTAEDKVKSEQREKAIEKANKWSSFYKHQLSTRQNDDYNRKLPEPFKDCRHRGNDFPISLFGIPMELHVKYGWMPKSSIAKALQQNWTAMYADMNGDHFYTLVKRADGSIAEINDSNVTEKRFPNVQAMIAYFTKESCKYGLRSSKRI